MRAASETGREGFLTRRAVRGKCEVLTKLGLVRVSPGAVSVSKTFLTSTFGMGILLKVRNRKFYNLELAS
jgi:hypothetical protein